MTKAILQCPFCGSTASVEEFSSASAGDAVVFSVGCDSTSEEDCMGYQSLTTFSTRAQAIKGWNKRACKELGGAAELNKAVPPSDRASNGVTSGLPSQTDRQKQSLYASVAKDSPASSVGPERPISKREVAGSIPAPETFFLSVETERARLAETTLREQTERVRELENEINTAVDLAAKYNSERGRALVENARLREAINQDAANGLQPCVNSQGESSSHTCKHCGHLIGHGPCTACFTEQSDPVATGVCRTYHSDGTPK